MYHSRSRSLQLPKHNSLLPACICITLGHGEPHTALMLHKAWVLKRAFGLETILPLPMNTIPGNINIKDTSKGTVNLGRLLPAQVINAFELIKGWF